MKSVELIWKLQDLIYTIQHISGVETHSISTSFIAQPGWHSVAIGIRVNTASLLLGTAHAGRGGRVSEIIIDGIAKPDPPQVNGPTSGQTGISYQFTVTSVDPNNDNVQFKILWGDNQETDWSAYVPSGSPVIKSHKYNNPGYYEIQVKVRDIDLMESIGTHFITIDLAPDTTPPETQILSGPSGTITYDDVTFTWTGSDDHTPTPNLQYSYKLEGYDGSWSSWTSSTSKNYYNLPDKEYIFKVKARDKAGNVDPTPATRSFTVDFYDTNPPETWIVTCPEGTIEYNDVNFSWDGADDRTPPGSLRYYFILEGYNGEWQGWTAWTHISYEDLPNGNYTFKAKAVDLAWNIDPTPATRSFTVDVHYPPETWIVTGPEGVINYSNVEFIWNGSDEHTPTENLQYSYKLIGYNNLWSPWSLSTSKSYYNLSNNQYTFMVKSKNTFGLEDPTPATRIFTVHATPPNNQPPNRPETPSGPSSLEILQNRDYITNAFDPNGDQVQYRFDWDAEDSHDYSIWTSLGFSGHIDSLRHCWDIPKVYVVKSQARDEYGATSPWSEGLTVVIPGKDSWPMFGHGPSNRRYSSSTAPNTNYVSWSYLPEKGMVHCAPVIADGKVYFCCDKFYCIDLNSKQCIWSNPFGSNQDPTVVDGRAYISRGEVSGGLFCINTTDGSLIWELSPDYGAVMGNFVVNDEKVYVHSGTIFHCLNASNRKEIWSKIIGPVVVPPTVVDGFVYVGSVDYKIYCFNANNGNLIWSYTTDDSVRSSPAVINSKVYVASEDGNVYCLDAGTGDLFWSYDVGHYFDSSPAVAYEKVYIVTMRKKIFCLNANNGEMIWNYTLDGSSLVCSNSPVVADNKVYISSDHGTLYCFNAENGEKLWSYLIIENEYDDATTSPAVANGTLYVGGTRLFCFEDIEGNHRPEIPHSPIGPYTGGPLFSHAFSANTTDRDGDKIYYMFDWDDGTNSGWLGPYNSGQIVEMSHRWKTGTYHVKVKAKDIYGSEGDWSYPAEITISWGYSTCLLGGIKVTMADGSYKKIEDIKVGDLVKSYDVNNKRNIIGIVTNTLHHVPEEMTDYYLIINNQLKVTPNHFLFKGETWVQAGELCLGDFFNLSNIRITSIQRVYERVPTYDLQVVPFIPGTRLLDNMMMGVIQLPDLGQGTLLGGSVGFFAEGIYTYKIPMNELSNGLEKRMFNLE